MSSQQLRAVIAAAADTLAQAGIDSARNDAELLDAHAAGAERGRLLLEQITPDFLERFDRVITERAKRVPLQHITGTAAFGPAQLEVGPGVFIPRPETEALLEWALAQELPKRPLIVDLCTGSGALAVALAAQLPGARVIGVDDDPAALEYARRNAAMTTVRLVRGDVADPRLLTELAGTVDLVVANPPYLACGAVLDPEVARHDPAHALFGGDDGMAVIAPVVNRASDWLRPGGLLAVEHDDTASAACVAMVEAVSIPGSLRSCPQVPVPGSLRSCPPVGAFTEVTAHRDLTGRPRFVTARRAPIPRQSR
ncbi:MAG: peptide chain release factor N(5)-glutamine methyltransferase [Mycobacterium sp.]|nr:peptide chain release factor N(5)-glutamine methyltransferase [Mycobacterium sp.]